MQMKQTVEEQYLSIIKTFIEENKVYDEEITAVILETAEEAKNLFDNSGILMCPYCGTTYDSINELKKGACFS